MGPLAIVAGVLGTVVSAVGSLASASAQAQNANYQAQVAKNNATLANYARINALAAGAQNAQQASLQSAARQAGIKAEISASGVDPNSGSASDVLTSQREEGQLNTENVYHNAQMQAYGYQIQGYGDDAQAKLDQSEAGQAGTAGILGAASSIIGGAKSFAGAGGGGGGSSSGSTGVLSDGDFGGLTDEMIVA